MDRGAWQVTLHEVTKGGIHLSKQQTTIVLFKSSERFSVISWQCSVQFRCSRSICGFVSLCFFVVPPGLPSHVPFSSCYLCGQWTHIGNLKATSFSLWMKWGFLQTFFTQSWVSFYSKLIRKVFVHIQHPSFYKTTLRRVLPSMMNRRAIRKLQEALWYGRGHIFKG